MNKKSGTPGECKCVTEGCSFHILNFLWCITEQTHGNMELPYIVKEQNNVNGWRHLCFCSLTDHRWEPIEKCTKFSLLDNSCLISVWLGNTPFVWCDNFLVFCFCFFKRKTFLYDDILKIQLSIWNLFFQITVPFKALQQGRLIRAEVSRYWSLSVNSHK